jgi:glycosyltransferase involved in cell wall biosynthesis
MNMGKFPLISVIIPAYNASSTIGICLRAVCASEYDNFEVIVVDDSSADKTSGVASGYPAELIKLSPHRGASAARNAGALAAKGQALFFIDADCVVAPDTLMKVSQAFSDHPGDVIGGTYTPIPYDRGFFSTFQSIYINHSETHSPEPDYIATHAMVIGRDIFERTGGFREDFMPILEDVDLSHRLRESGIRLVMRPEIEVAHIFNFNLRRSLKNAYRKSRYWVRYSMGKGDILADSGTASIGLKAMAACTGAALVLFMLGLLTGSTLILLLPPLPFLLGMIINAGIIESFFHHGGYVFGLMAVPYYTLVYPMAAAAGGIAGLIDRLRGLR